METQLDMVLKHDVIVPNRKVRSYIVVAGTKDSAHIYPSR